MPTINVSLPDTAEVMAAEAIAAIERVGGTIRRAAEGRADAGGDDGSGAESSGPPPGLHPSVSSNGAGSHNGTKVAPSLNDQYFYILLLLWRYL